MQITSTDFAFAALKADGSIVSWGSVEQGGERIALPNTIGSSFRQIVSTGTAFAALKADGTVVTWGDRINGGDMSSVAKLLTDIIGFANPFMNDRLIFTVSK